MKFEKIQKLSPILVTTKGTYVNSKGKRTNHPRGKNSAHAERKPLNIKFIGVDGEGMDVNGQHRYVLFGVGDRQIEDTGGLRFSDVFEVLYDTHRTNGSRDTAYTGFFLGYDFSQIFKTLPEDRARMLLTKEGRAARVHKSRDSAGKLGPGRVGMPPHPVEYDGWQFDMLGMKRLRIRPKGCDCVEASCKCKNKASWMYICDVGSFFQSSFLKVIDPKGWPEGDTVVSPDEWMLIKAGKEKRSTATLDDEMRMYNRLENIVLSRVMHTLDRGFRDIGVNLSPSKWFGPGQAAQAWIKSVGVPTREDLTPVIPLRFVEAARASYFGGWFEIMMHGIIPGVTHEYDINSAYPSVIANLPCLLHGSYSYGEGIPEKTKERDLTLVYATIHSPGQSQTWKYKDVKIGTMLHRHKGQISRPMNTEGWFWLDELQAAERAGLIVNLKKSIVKWARYAPCDCKPPMSDIAGLYQKRLQVGKTTPRGKAAKLVYNSAYGKFAQSEGMNPIYGNAIYASRITSLCRSKILDAIASHPYGKADVAMVATDAVYFLHPHPSLPCSENLGNWDYVARNNLTLYKPGVYWDDAVRERIANGENPNFKARGFKASDFIKELGRVDDEFKSWDLIPDDAMEHNYRTDKAAFGLRNGWAWPKVTFKPTFVMITAVQALQRNKWDLAGVVLSDPKELTQSADPFMKRQRIYREIYHGRKIYRSIPITHTYVPSEPYDKRFGMEDPWSDESKAEMGETEEGRLMDILGWILNGD